MQNVIDTNNAEIETINNATFDVNRYYDYTQETVRVYEGLSFTGRRPNFSNAQAIGEYRGIVCEAGDIIETVHNALRAAHPGCFFVIVD